jgi:hypothetical protein
MSAFAQARRVLDEVQHLAELEAFETARFAEALRDEASPAGEDLAALGNQLDEPRRLLEEVDRFAQKSMRIRLTSSTDALPQQFRTLLFSTIVSYQRDLPLLRGRVAAALGRIDRTTAAGVSERVMQAAEAVLAGRAALRQVVLELAQRIATAWLPTVQRTAGDRSQPEGERRRWGSARLDLERVAANGEAIEAGSFADRLKTIEPPPDEPEAPGPSRFSLLEID